MTEIKWLGRGGQGAFTASRLLGIAASIYEGHNAQAFPSFGPERRGAPVSAFTRISDSMIRNRSEIASADYLIILDVTLYSPEAELYVKKGGTVLVNTVRNINVSNSGIKIIGFDSGICGISLSGNNAINTVMLGAFISVSEIVNLSSAEKAIESEMNPSVAAKNIDIIRKAYSRMKELL
jgi:pyruvate ferredoxin oxidoreductase gamma subunit